MNGLGRVRTWLDRIIAAVFMLSITHPAWGIPIPLLSGSIIPGTVWQISYAAPISLEFDAAVTTNNTVGTIIETTIRTNLAPLAIDFLQVFETTTSGISGGLRLNFQEKVTNASPLAWPYYRMTLVDAISGPDTVLNNGDHPAPPHFHQTKQIATTPASKIHAPIAARAASASRPIQPTACAQPSGAGAGRFIVRRRNARLAMASGCAGRSASAR